MWGAEAGMVTCLPTRTSVLGVTNPRGAFNPAAAHTSAATNLSAPLLSRFDAVLLLSDVHEPAWDYTVSEQVLRNHQQGAAQGSQEAPLPCWPVDVLRAYVAWVRGRGSAQQELTMSPEAEAVLLAYYQAQRRSEGRSAARTTIRLLESLVRLAQAHARLMARGRVGLQDAVIAVMVADASMAVAALLGPNNALHTHAPQDADADYAALERAVLAELGLHHLMSAAPGPPGDGGGG
ncbi:DNA replication licensing factor MCM9 [Monoraphidium neglectum]|uniref:DNA helicase n=1 Tax=Monoraphidium neglectum TaxID=145388 RepID=A0A0D2MJF6_9CHLO|nr:DNA replication licensing factor MCM9 [Monoraphidium neglectum]KIZ00747.1 DNA replication licensing factor MCM9 [Monoraphidium neglectum]|eukprot:XP_013899766.1 DNA replication licensing factor MCM9 [Monoraphidium neglectum]